MLRITEREIAEIEKRIKDAKERGATDITLEFKLVRDLLTDRDALISDLRLAAREIGAAKDSLALQDNSAALARLASIDERLDIPA